MPRRIHKMAIVSWPQTLWRRFALCKLISTKALRSAISGELSWWGTATATYLPVRLARVWGNLVELVQRSSRAVDLQARRRLWCSRDRQLVMVAMMMMTSSGRWRLYAAASAASTLRTASSPASSSSCLVHLTHEREREIYWPQADNNVTIKIINSCGRLPARKIPSSWPPMQIQIILFYM